MVTEHKGFGLKLAHAELESKLKLRFAVLTQQFHRRERYRYGAPTVLRFRSSDPEAFVKAALNANDATL